MRNHFHGDLLLQLTDEEKKKKKKVFEAQFYRFSVNMRTRVRSKKKAIKTKLMEIKRRKEKKNSSLLSFTAASQ